MSQEISISWEDIFKQVKLTCQFPSLIEGIVIRKVMATAADEVGIKVETKELQEAADKLRLMNSLNSVDETRAWLQKNSLSLDDFEELVYEKVISGRLAQHLFSDKVEHYFFEHQHDYAGAIIYEVVLDDEDLAIELFYGLQEGEIRFSEITHQYIQDTELRRRGGYLGNVSRKEMKPEISAAIFAAQPPQILKPIVTSKGVHLILVEEIMQAQFDEKLYYQILSQLFGDWVKKQIDNVEFIMDLTLGSQLV